jgi:protein-disulfide isomerase
MARIGGMSAEQAEQCMTSTEKDGQINKVASEGQSRYAISSTPTFILNGKPYSELPFEQLTKVLDQALAAH